MSTTKKNSSKKTTTTTQTATTTQPQDAARSVCLGFISATEETVEGVLAGMKEGEKVSMDSITSAVGAKLGIKADRAYPFVSLYIKSRPGMTVATGRQGGVYRGAPPAKALDPEAQARLAKKLEKATAAAVAAAAKAEALRARVNGTVAPVAAS